MQPWKFVRTNIGAYFKRWGSYIVLTSGTSLFISLIMIPIFNAMTQLCSRTVRSIMFPTPTSSIF